MRSHRSRLDNWLLRPLALALHHVHRSSLRRPGVAVAIAVIVIVAVLPVVPRMRVALSIRDAIDPDSSATSELKRSDASFGRAYSFLLLLRSTNPSIGFDVEQSRAIEEWIADCEARPGVVRLRSPMQLLRVTESGESLLREPRLQDLTANSLSALQSSPWQGIWTDSTCRDVAVEVTVAPSTRPTRYGLFDPTQVDRIVGDARRRLGEVSGGIEISVAGVGAFEAETLRGIRRFRLLNLGVVVLLLLLARAALGTWRSGVLLLVPVITASAVVYGGMALRGDPIDMLSTGLFLLLSVAAIEDFFFVSHLRMNSGTRWRAPFRRLLLPSMLTSLTTILGFGSLLMSDLEIVRRLGLWAATGALVEWAATFLVLPSLMAIVPAAQRWTDPRRAWGVGALERVAHARWPRAVGVGLLGVLVAGLIGAFHLNFSDSPERTFPSGHPYHRSMEQLSLTRGWTGSFWVIAPARDDDPIDDYEAEWIALDDVLRILRRWPEVTAVLDPASALDDLMDGQRSWLERLTELREDERRLDFAQLAAADGSLRAQVFLRDVELETVVFLRDFVRGLGADTGVYPSGELVAYSEFAQSVPRALLRSLITCLVLVGSVLALVVGARGGVPTVPVLAAAAWGPALVLAVIAVFAVPVNFLTCVFASVLVGLTGDNALQYVFARDRAPITTGAAVRGAASIHVALVMSACALVFLGSAFVASRRLGLLLGLGLIASLVGDLWILRSLLPERSSQ